MEQIKILASFESRPGNGSFEYTYTIQLTGDVLAEWQYQLHGCYTPTIVNAILDSVPGYGVFLKDLRNFISNNLLKVKFLGSHKNDTIGVVIYLTNGIPLQKIASDMWHNELLKDYSDYCQARSKAKGSIYIDDDFKPLRDYVFDSISQEIIAALEADAV